jgi:DNA-binding response OmpR family regulator
MRVLVIDRDRLTSQLLQNRLESEGHQVVVEPVRKTALDMLATESFDVIIIDPAPLPSARQIALPLRWEQKHDYFYLVQLGHDPDPQEVVRCGLNAAISKPFDWQEVATAMANAQRLTGFMRYLRDTADLETDGLVFTKRGFYKLVLSALDRAYRYGEQAFLLSIRQTNIDAMVARMGPQAAQAMVKSTADFLTRLHRMSDFLGRTDEAEHVLLLLRPAADHEPQDAADRFSIALREFQAQVRPEDRPEFMIELWALPSGGILVQSKIS